MKIELSGGILAACLLFAGGQALAASGKAVYDSTCSACHAFGAAGAPKLGDKAAWAPRLRDMAALNASAIKGKGIMPAKGGNSSLSHADVIAAVAYMTSQSK